MRTEPGARLQPVDALRGLMIASMFLVSSRNPIIQFRHVPWFGFHIADLVYSGFLFVIGVSLTLSFRAQLARGVTESTLLKKVLRRSIILFFIGLLLLAASYGMLRFNLGTLQCIALVSVLSAPLVLRSNLLKVGFIFASYLTVLALELFVGNPDGVLSGSSAALNWMPGMTFNEFLDHLVFGKSKAPEGLLSTFNSIPVCCWGMLAGAELGSKHQARKIFFYGMMLLLAGYLAMMAGVPISPKLVTPSFSLVAAGVSSLILCFFVILLDELHWNKMFHPLVIYGSNALAAYVFVKCMQVYVYGGAFFADGSTLKDVLATSMTVNLGQAAGDISFPVLKVLTGWMFCLVLYRKRIFIKL